MLLSKGNLQEELQDLQHLEEITGTHFSSDCFCVCMSLSLSQIFFLVYIESIYQRGKPLSNLIKNIPVSQTLLNKYCIVVYCICTVLHCSVV